MRLIDADEFEVISWQAQGGGEWASGFDEGVSYVVSKIDDAPTIDAVPVVRCRDCKFCFHFRGTLICSAHTGFGNCYVLPEFYCSNGEREDGGEE